MSSKTIVITLSAGGNIVVSNQHHWGYDVLRQQLLDVQGLNKNRCKIFNIRTLYVFQKYGTPVAFDLRDRLWDLKINLADWGIKMQPVMSWTFRNSRLLAAILAVSGFAILYLAARVFGADLKFAFLSDDQVRTICHFTGYGCLAVLVHIAIRRQVWLSWIIALSLAWGEEFHQLVVPGRYFTLDDLLVNFLGVTIFLIVAHKLHLIERLGRQLDSSQAHRTATA